MSPLFPALLIGGAGLVALVLLLRYAAKTSKRAHERVSLLAAELGLAMEPAAVTFGLFHGAPRARGERRGKKVELYNYTTGSGKSRTTWSSLSAQPRADGGLKFKITGQGFGSKIAQLFGAKEIQVGDGEFDGAWFIETNRPDFFAAALLPELRAKLHAATRGAPRPSFKMENGKVLYSEVGGFFNDARCARFLLIADVVCDFADIAEVHATGAGR
ncbi:MAG: hypothetical protein ABIZ81_18350 [Opitutaceae bacterium]